MRSIFFSLARVMQANAVVLLAAGHMDVPPTWLRPGTAVIHCGSALMTGRTDLCQSGGNIVIIGTLQNCLVTICF